MTTYIFLAESIFLIENMTGISISKKLNLSTRLQKKAIISLNENIKSDTFQQFGEDPLFFRRKPGSYHISKYDGTDKFGVYKTVVDETGFLNIDKGSYEKSEKIDIFFSGDSVLQGVGMPSCIEQLKIDTGISMWNLSTGSYSPRQKIHALMAFALEKKPVLLVFDFFSGNDACESNEDVIAMKKKKFEFRFDRNWLEYNLSESEEYKDLVTPGLLLDTINLVKRIRADSLTLSLTNSAVYKLRILIEKVSASGHKERINPSVFTKMTYPAYSEYSIEPDKYSLWIIKGMEHTLNNYKKLLDQTALIKDRPEIIILYNPTAYEIYRDILVKREAVFDTRASIQLNMLKSFAEKNNIILIDLLEEFRKRINQNPVIWIYGENDTVHWSPTGSKIAAEIIGKSILPYVKKH